MKNQVEVMYRVHERAIDKVKGEYAGMLSLDEGFAMLIVKTSKGNYQYIPLINVVCFHTTDLFTNLDPDFEDRSTT